MGYLNCYGFPYKKAEESLSYLCFFSIMKQWLRDWIALFYKQGYRDMGMFLNSKLPYEAFAKLRQDIYFVDKTLILDELASAIGKINCYVCITRPPPFWKNGNGKYGKCVFWENK